MRCLKSYRSLLYLTQDEEVSMSPEGGDCGAKSLNKSKRHLRQRRSILKIYGNQK